MKKLGFFFAALAFILVLTANIGAETPEPIDTSHLVTVYTNDFNEDTDLFDFDQYNGTFKIRNGRVWLDSVEDGKSSLLIFDDYNLLETMHDYVVDVDMYNIQTQAGVIVRSQNGSIPYAEVKDGDNFYGYFAYTSFDGTVAAIGYGAKDGTWGGVLTSEKDVLAPEADVHIQVAVQGNVISYYIYCLYTDVLLYSGTVSDDTWSSGSFGFRFYNNINDGLDNLKRTSFDNLKVSTFAKGIEIKAGSKAYKIDGVESTLRNRPTVKNGVLMMPVRTIVDALGGSTGITKNEGEYEIQLGSKYVTVTIGSTEGYLNNFYFPLPIEPYYEYTETAYFPIAAILEKLGYNTKWSLEDGTLFITADSIEEETGDNIESAVSGYYEYKVENGNAVITKYTGKEEKVVIPESLGGYPVTRIGDSAFESNKMKALVIHGGVREIGEAAFRSCTGLYDISFSEGLLSIGVEAFKNCFVGYSSKKAVLDLPESVRFISAGAFSGCSDIVSVDLPDNLLILGKAAFYSCMDIETIILPDGLTSIGSSAFEGSRPILNYVYIPSSVEEIQTSAFFSDPDRYVGMTLEKIYYGGSAEQFLSTSFADGNLELINTEKVFGASAYTFVTNGGTSLSPLLCKEPLETAPVTTKKNYKLDGWYEDPSFAGTPVEFPYNAGGSVTLYASWSLDADVDGDGETSFADALAAIKTYASGGESVDLSGDGKFTLADLLLFLKSI